MGRLEDLQAFARVVDARGFSGAARLLGTTKSAVSKQVGRLEDQLGTRLLHRTTRSVSATAEGRAVYERALRLLEESLALETELAGHRDEARGVLRLSTSTAFGNLQFTGLMAEFCARHPRLEVVLGLNDRYVDLAEEGFDVVLRLTAKPSEGLVAPICRLRASPRPWRTSPATAACASATCSRPTAGASGMPSWVKRRSRPAARCVSRAG
jgi:DNA-binding transcriptional LysR family regulator